MNKLDEVIEEMINKPIVKFQIKDLTKILKLTKSMLFIFFQTYAFGIHIRFNSNNFTFVYFITCN